jgi:hypothetical protein
MDTKSTSRPLGPTSVVHVPVEALGYFWPVVGPLLQKAIDEMSGELDLDDVYSRVQSTHMQLLIAVDADRVLAAFVTEVVNYPKRKALRLVLGGGSASRRWRVQLRDILHAGARAVGASMLELYGRKGWMKILSVFPKVTVKYYVLMEDVENG